ncbi:MAG: GNAT family protein [Candidatus Bipolaricaulota bacterium]
MRPEIVGDHVCLRAYRRLDVDALHEAVVESIAEVAPYETWCHPGYTRDEAEEYVAWWIQARERKTAFYYVIVDARSGEVLGSCGISEYSPEHRHAMLGYWVRSSATRHGVATAAARGVVAAAFEDLGLLRVSIGVPVGNAASHRVVAKLGAVREGVLRQGLVLPDGPTDVVLYGLLEGELRER